MTPLAVGTVTSGLAGFLVFLALVVGAVLLFRSMTRHLRRVPPRFDDPQPPVADTDDR